jgi:polysaccharide biosynthesis transport protein
MSEAIQVQKHLIRDFVQGAGKDFDIVRYYQLFLRHLWLVGLIVTVALIGTFAWLSRQPKEYGSRAVVLVEQQQRKILSNMEEVQPENLETEDYLNTVVQSLTSESLMLRVAHAIGLEKDPKIFPPQPDGKSYSDPAIAKAMRHRVAAALRRGTRLIDITVEDEYPERAKEIADTVVKEFFRQTFEQKYSVSRLASDFLQEQADKLKAKLDQSEEKLQAYKERNNAVSLEQNQNITVDKLKELNTRVTAAKDARIKVESDIEQLRRLKPDDVDGMLQISSVAAIPQVASVRTQIVQAEAELAALKKRYLPLHPTYIKAVTTIQRLKESLQETLRDAGKILATQYASARDTESKLTTALNEQEKAALDLSKLAIPYNVLEREVQSDRAMYDSLVARVRQTTISEGIEKNPFHVVEEPMASTVPVKPEKMKIMMIAFVFALIVAAVLVIILDSLDESLRSVDQAEQFLGLPALAIIPEEQRPNSVMLPIMPILLNYSQTSRQAEAFRTVRASLSLLGGESSRRVFLFASALPAEGKTFCSVNTAMAFCVEGLRTVVVEADLRRPSLHKLFKGLADRNTPGLSDVLAGNEPLDTVIRPGPAENLSFLFAGRRSPNPAELLASKSFPLLIEALLERFDRVICDSAPINAVSDTLTLISAVQHVCLVVRPEKTPKRAIARACHLVDKAGGKLAGFLLNRVKFKYGSGRHYYYYYGDEYYGKDNLEKAGQERSGSARQ